MQMFKKKELLVILILALLVAGLSWFSKTEQVVNGAEIDVGLRARSYICRGFPFVFWRKESSFLASKEGMLVETLGLHPLGEFLLRFFLIDFLFWFLLLAGGWWMYKRFLKGKDKRYKS